MSIPNYNEELQCAYGVVSANTFPHLADDIICGGTSLDRKMVEEELLKIVRDALDDEDESLSDAVARYLSIPLAEAQELTAGCDGDDSAEDQAAEIWEQMGYRELLQFEEETFEYEDTESGTQYLLSHLGGAPIIFVTHSRWAVRARPCSPCIPGVGDLNSLTLKTEGMPCLSPPPSDWNEVDTQPIPTHFWDISK